MGPAGVTQMERSDGRLRRRIARAKRSRRPVKHTSQHGHETLEKPNGPKRTTVPSAIRISPLFDESFSCDLRHTLSRLNFYNIVPLTSDQDTSGTWQITLLTES